MSATIRKNFVFDAAVAHHLEELAIINGKSLTKTMQDLIEDQYKEILKRQKLELFYSLVGSGNGLFTDFSVQKTKSRML